MGLAWMNGTGCQAVSRVMRTLTSRLEGEEMARLALPGLALPGERCFTAGLISVDVCQRHQSTIFIASVPCMFGD